MLQIEEGGRVGQICLGVWYFAKNARCSSRSGLLTDILSINTFVCVCGHFCGSNMVFKLQIQFFSSLFAKMASEATFQN